MEGRENVEHTIIEHDGEWIRFFSNEMRFPRTSNVIRLELGSEEWRGQKVNRYMGLSAAIKGQRFDLLSIDGPFGSSGLSRVDML